MTIRRSDEGECGTSHESKSVARRHGVGRKYERNNDEARRTRARNSLSPIGGEGQGEGATEATWQAPHAHWRRPRLRPTAPQAVHGRGETALALAPRPTLRGVQIPPSVSMRHLPPRLLLHAGKAGRGTRWWRTRFPGPTGERRKAKSVFRRARNQSVAFLESPIAGRTRSRAV